MSAVLGDLLQFNVRQTLFGQDVFNVFYYRVTSLTGFDNTGYQPLLNEFRDTVIAMQILLQSSNLEYREIELKNLSNGIDFVTETYLPSDLTGGQALASLPSYLCYTFRLLRETLTTRNGYKRVAGVPEAWVTGNEYIGSSTPLEDYSNALAADIVLGVVTICEPVIVKRPITVPAGTSYLYSSVGGSDFSRIGTQNTRKPGSGS